jgi:membrane protein insertase Oxa1/YidC/SpoIIIJ
MFWLVFMEKKIIIVALLLLALLLPFSFAESIASYKVPSSVPLNQGVTATGLYVPDTNIYSNKLCSFYFLDSESNLITRADDQLTDATGRFAMPPFTLTEPLFQRDGNFSLMTVCGTATATDSFVVAQKQEAFDIAGFKFFPQSVGWDMKYLLNSDNLFALMWVIVIFGFIIFILGMFFIER